MLGRPLLFTSEILIILEELQSVSFRVSAPFGADLRQRNWEGWARGSKRSIFLTIENNGLLSWIQKGFTAEPPRNDSGRIVSEMIRIEARKSELQAKSRSYRPKVTVTARQTPGIRTESPRKGPRMGFRCFYRKPPLKPS